MAWFRYRRRRRRSTVTQHYLAHKEEARTIILARLQYWSSVTGYQYNKVAIRNQKSRWGSCSESGNLNFSYKLIFLPPSIMDYIIMHELCHTQVLNHSKDFWRLVGVFLPDYKNQIKALRTIEKMGWTAYYKKVRSNEYVISYNIHDQTVEKIRRPYAGLTSA